MRYVFHRLVSGVLLLLTISVLVFAVSEAAPGDFLSDLELDPRIPRETVEVLRQRYGLDRSVVVRYFAWLRSVFAGELGYSLAYDMPVAELLLPRARNTLLLTLPANAFVWAAALVAGTWMAWREGAWVDRLGLVLSAVLLSVPPLLVGLGFLFLAAWSRLLPLGGMTSLDFESLGALGRLRDLAWHLALPMTALVLTHLPPILHHVRSALIEVLDAPFLRAGRGHGIPPVRLLFRYALPAAAHPLISLLGISAATLLSGALLIEIILSWPGMGPLLVDSILGRDLHVVVSATLLSAVFVVAGQLLSDLLLYWADPRIRGPV